MKTSDTIGSLAAALAKAQGEMKNATKDAQNPFFKSRYADLASIVDACREALSKNSIAVIQTPRMVENAVEIDTIMAHASGEWISETLRVPVNMDKQGMATAQGMGSAITYGRRYALAAFAGIAPEDDDGHSASHCNGFHGPPPQDPVGYSSDFIAASAAQLREWQKACSLAKTREHFKDINDDFKGKWATITEADQVTAREAFNSAYAAYKKNAEPSSATERWQG